MQQTTTSRKRFFISLMLIVISFVLLFAIAYQSLRFQEQVLIKQNTSEKLERLDHISKDFFTRLQTEELPENAIRLPLEKPILPLLKVPDSSSSRQTFLRIAIEPFQKQALLLEAELNAANAEQFFWRYLLLNEYFNSGNYFEMRRIASLIVNSNFDFLLDNGKTLKTEAIVNVAEAFLRENNPEAAKQWLTRLRSMPVPAILPKQPAEWFSIALPVEIESWLQVLQTSYQLSYAPQIKTGWSGDLDRDALILQHNSGLCAIPAGTVITALQQRFSENGFADIARPSVLKASDTAHLLAKSEGLWVNLINDGVQPVPGGFLMLLLLTSVGILGLFTFALHEWQLMQKARLLDEEEQFFRQTAHDLKTPITIVSFLAETLALKRYKSEEQCNRYLAQLQTETQRAAELFDRLLLSVRLRKKTVNADLKNFPADDAIKNMLLRFRSRINDWEVIEQYAENNEIVADPDMFERVMINLIENVIRHASDGRQIAVKLCSTPGSKGAEISVMIGDKGSTFPLNFEAEKIDLLNSSLPYRQERGGSGTGLFLVRQIMQTHGGQFFATHKNDGGIWMVTTWRAAQ